MSFLDKLKVKVEEKETNAPEETQAPEARAKEKMAMSFLQLEVDILQTASEIYVIAPIPGVDVKELDISIENENDVVTIQGKREMPDIDVKDRTEDEDEDERKFLRQECQWGPFYRQIILPQEIDVAGVKAKFKNGILILKLPLLRLHTKGKKKIMVEF